MPDRRAWRPLRRGARPDRRPGHAADRGCPSPLTSFIGRGGERAELADARGHRLVTAVGPGGVGKTRLALTVVADIAGVPDGAWFVDLVPVTDPDMVAPAVAAALGVGEHQGALGEDTVIGWLADAGPLLVLDNCEHLLDGATASSSGCWPACPG